MCFVNKMDRPSQDPFSLMDEVEDQLKIKVRPLSWPINNGPDFKGVYNIFNRSLNGDLNMRVLEGLFRQPALT